MVRWLLLTALAVLPIRAGLVSETLFASLTSGSLAGVTFPATFSYDPSGVNPVGTSFAFLQSFDFVLLGVPFNQSNISQGGQAVFQNGVLNNVTASFQGSVPTNSPVDNITFGFGGPGVIGYQDLSRAFGSGTFTFAVPEPASILLAGVALLWLHPKCRRSSAAICSWIFGNPSWNTSSG